MFDSMRFSQSFLLAAVIAAAVCAPAQQVIGDVYASDASVKGSVMLVGGGTRLLSGSSVTAGSAPALVKLARGGSVRVCSNTSISVATSQKGRDLLMGMSTGNIEAHYDLGATTDSLLTPDFRIQVPGPGSFHFAFGADARGNTCIRSLPQNTASVIVTELMGDGTYQVKPGEQVRFAAGQIANASSDAGECGCPAPEPPVLKAAAPPEPPKKVETATVAQAITPSEAKLTAPPPPIAAGEVHVAVEAPFTFSATDAAPVPDPPPVIRMNISSLPIPQMPPVLAPPPLPAPAAEPVQQAAQDKPKKRGFFGKLRAFFASAFKG